MHIRYEVPNVIRSYEMAKIQYFIAAEFVYAHIIG